MDFYKYKCPVCNKQFKEGDDIVVCPECGTPHSGQTTISSPSLNCLLQTGHLYL